MYMLGTLNYLFCHIYLICRFGVNARISGWSMAATNDDDGYLHIKARKCFPSNLKPQKCSAIGKYTVWNASFRTPLIHARCRSKSWHWSEMSLERNWSELIGIDRNWTTLGSMPEFWSALIGIGHWSRESCSLLTHKSATSWFCVAIVWKHWSKQGRNLWVWQPT